MDQCSISSRVLEYYTFSVEKIHLLPFYKVLNRMKKNLFIKLRKLYKNKVIKSNSFFNDERDYDEEIKNEEFC